MDEELKQKIDAQQEKIDEIYKEMKKLKRYFLWTFWLTVVFFVLPLVALVFVVPWFLSTYLGSMGMGGGADPEQMMQMVKTLQSLQ